MRSLASIRRPMEEVQGLVEPSTAMRIVGPSKRCRMVGLLILLSILVTVPWLGHSGGVNISMSTLRTTGTRNFQCTEQNITYNHNHEDVEAVETYLDPKKQPVFDDSFLETFRDTKFDGWSHTFHQRKESIYDWKKKHYAPFLQNGSTIFESACGLGLSIYLTLEILQETANLGELTVYGNEYVGENAAKANPMLDVLLENQSAGNKVGGICQGDSTDLSWVPPNQFDLVFTGYISPLWDPLDFGLEFDANYDRMKELCKHAGGNSSDHWMETKLAAIAQQRQEQWASLWVREMTRIAKPGAPVILENVAFPYCDQLRDYGGVSQEFFKTGSEVYGWDIDPESLEFAYRDKKKRRYHVFMKKRFI